MDGQIEVELEGFHFRLHPDGGLYWPEKRSLFVADTHFGKAATFRKHAIPVPKGSTESTLTKLNVMLSATDAQRLVILGDMFHAKSSLSGDVRESIETFFHLHENVQFTLIRGNHDSSVGPLPDDWPLKTLPPGTTLGRVMLSHYPDEPCAESDLVLCGHLHPAVRFASVTDRLKLPCYWLRRRCLVLPAIGQFTGTEVIRPSKGDRVWMIADGRVFEAMTSRARR